MSESKRQIKRSEEIFTKLVMIFTPLCIHRVITALCYYKFIFDFIFLDVHGALMASFIWLIIVIISSEYLKWSGAVCTFYLGPRTCLFLLWWMIFWFPIHDCYNKSAIIIYNHLFDGLLSILFGESFTGVIKPDNSHCINTIQLCTWSFVSGAKIGIPLICQLGVLEESGLQLSCYRLFASNKELLVFLSLLCQGQILARYN